MRDTIIIGDLQVWPEDLGEMNWATAMEKVKELGPGWRLPTKEEFENVLEPNKAQIPNLKDRTFLSAYYWSSIETDVDGYTWAFLFDYGRAYGILNHETAYVLPVRDLNGDTALELLLKEF